MESATWPLDSLEQALEALARRTGLAGGERAVPLTSPDAEPGPRIARSASRLGLEAEPVESLHGDVERMLAACGPALVLLPEGSLLAVTACRRGRLKVLGPDLKEHRLPAAEVARTLAAETEAPAGEAVDRLVERAGVTGRRREGVRAALLGERLRRRRVPGVWLLRLPPGSGFLRQMLQAGLHRHLFGFVAAYTVSYSLLLASWGALGVGALQGRIVPGALAAWALLLLTLVPFRLVSVWSRARLIVGLGALLKRRLLAGALKLQPEEIRHQGAGQLLGRVIESEAVETLALQGGFLTVVGLIETALAAVVVAAGSGGGRHLLLLALWVLVTLGLARWFFRHRREWTTRRLEMTHGLVERLVGHRTRLVQEPRERWHLEEDRLLDAYLRDSGRLDRSKAVLLAAAPRGWLLAGLAGLLPGFLAGTATPALLALGVGGTLAAYRGLAKISEGFGHLSGALLSWQQAEDLFQAAARNEPAGATVSPARPDTRQDAVVLEALDLTYRHRGRGRAVLDGCALRVARGERILLEGPSGGGKSTLAALLTGLREPGSGLVLLDGVDRYTVGAEAWRRRVVLAPQFHENHVFTETFGFNLLMGRGWPAGEADLAEAVAVCRELGLGGLLDRMPAGLQQIVGETGWQLSHGERSRVYMARALLQGAEVVVLDESFAALDPENLHQALDCALRRAPALVVIAHP